MDIFDVLEFDNEFDGNYDLKDLVMRVLPSKQALDFVKKYHYSRSANGCSVAYGHFYNDKLVNVILYKPPTGRMMAQQVLDGGTSDNVWELIRMVSYEPKPKNLESYCISNTFKHIRNNFPNIEVPYLVFKVLSCTLSPSKYHSIVERDCP